MSAYYNENDPKAAAWLRELIKAGLIAPGEVDERSIADVQADDLRGFTQCHFFAGIGGWSYALRLAGVSDSELIWTGSCPCQPFSAAGKRKGTADERHLWPWLFNLITECAPAIVFGEQVASTDGRIWLDGVFADLEDMGYRPAGADLCAAGVGAPHIRQRLYWLAYANGGHASTERQQRGGEQRFEPQDCGAGRMGDAGSEGFSERERNGQLQREAVGAQPRETAFGGSDTGYWSRFDILNCLDGKARRVESGAFPLAHGVSGRVGLLRGYGNAIVPQVAAAFIQAAIEAIGDATSEAD